MRIIETYNALTGTISLFVHRVSHSYTIVKALYDGYIVLCCQTQRRKLWMHNKRFPKNEAIFFSPLLLI